MFDHVSNSQRPPHLFIKLFHLPNLSCAHRKEVTYNTTIVTERIYIFRPYFKNNIFIHIGFVCAFPRQFYRVLVNINIFQAYCYLLPNELRFLHPTTAFRYIWRFDTNSCPPGAIFAPMRRGLIGIVPEPQKAVQKGSITSPFATLSWQRLSLRSGAMLDFSLASFV